MNDDASIETRPSSPARRRLLIAGSTVVAAGAIGGVWMFTRLDGTQAWIESVIRQHLAGFALDAASLATFVSECARERIFADRKASLAVMFAQAAPSLTERVAKANRRVERLERFVITQYLMGSNFFRVPDPRRTTIIYGGALPACGNPFATFR